MFFVSYCQNMSIIISWLAIVKTSESFKEKIVHWLPANSNYGYSAVYTDQMDFSLKQAMLKKGEVSSFGVIEPDCIGESLLVQVRQLVHEWAGKLTKNN